jgi:tetratricopeptide (TPR) repeat protein
MSTRFKSFFFLVFTIFTLALVGADGQADVHFDAGLTALQKNDLKTARTEFQAALQQNPTQAQLYYDLGLVEFNDQHLGLAIGLWRKALALNPGDRTTETALAFATKKLAHPSIAHEAESYEALRESLIAPTPLWRFLLLANSLLLFCGWLLLAYVGKRRRAMIDETPAPPVPYLGAVFGLLCLIFFSLSVAKWLDLQTPRATVTPATVAVRTSPEEKSAALYDLFEGLEVVVQQASNDWLQVTYPGGLTGWVPKSAVILTSGPGAGQKL